MEAEVVGRWSRRLPLTTLVALTIAGCTGKEPECPYEEPEALAALGGESKLGEPINLDATGSTASCERGLAYTWSFKQLPLESALSDADLGDDNGKPDAESVEWIPDALGTYVLSLIVNDGVVNSTEDLLSIEVTTDNLPPSADAGEDQWGQINTRASFDGSDSIDEDEDPIQYKWVLVNRPDDSLLSTGDLFDADTATPSIIPDQSGTYVVSLQVYDGLSWSNTDYASLFVVSENQAPVANAGESTTLPPCTDSEFIQLNGNGSYDPEGDTLTYQWLLQSVPEGSLATPEDISDPTLAAPQFRYDLLGTYEFALQVNDGTTPSPYDVVAISVVDPSNNRGPTVIPGTYPLISQESICGLDGCSSCASFEFPLDATGTFDPEGDTLSYYWSDPSGQLSFQSPHLAYTSVIIPELQVRGAPYSWQLNLVVEDCNMSVARSVSISVRCQN